MKQEKQPWNPEKKPNPEQAPRNPQNPHHAPSQNPQKKGSKGCSC